MKILVTIVAVVLMTTNAIAGVFDISADSKWRKVQDAEITQWSVIPEEAPKTRLNLVSYVEGGVRTTYYYIQREVGGEFETYIIKPGNKLGFDKNGMPSSTPLLQILDQVEKLPKEASDLLPRS